MIDRQEIINEINLRSALRELIAEVYSENRRGHVQHMIKEHKLRNYLRGLIELVYEVKGTEPDPELSTGINRLNVLLKQILPPLENGYKSLTSSVDQRESYRAHILHGVMNTIKPPRALKRGEIRDIFGMEPEDVFSNYEDIGDVGNEGTPGDNLEAPVADDRLDNVQEGEQDPYYDIEEAVFEQLTNLLYTEGYMKDGQFVNEDVTISVDDGPIQIDGSDDSSEDFGDQSKFIDPDGSTEEDQVDLEDEFGSGLQQMDPTGRNFALDVYQRIEKQILEAYNSIEGNEDSEEFYIWLLTNMKLWFDRWEGEMAPSVEEPTTDEYEQEVEDLQQPQNFDTEYQEDLGQA